MARTLVDAYIRQLRSLTSGTPWIDETFRKKLDPITEDQAFVRPLPDIHSIAELVWHLHIWRLTVLDRIELKAVTVLDADNFSDNDRLRQMGWKALLEVFYSSQEKVIALLEKVSDEDLAQVGPTGTTFGEYFEGLIHHDCYHMGQLGLVIKGVLATP